MGKDYADGSWRMIPFLMYLRPVEVRDGSDDALAQANREDGTIRKGVVDARLKHRVFFSFSLLKHLTGCSNHFPCCCNYVSGKK